MAEGNGIDLGSIVAMLQSVLNAQEAARTEFQDFRRSVEVRLAGIEARLASVEHRLNRVEYDVASVRQTLGEYHAAVVGHGISITDLDERVRRIEQRLNIEPSH